MNADEIRFGFNSSVVADQLGLRRRSASPRLSLEQALCLEKRSPQPWSIVTTRRPLGDLLENAATILQSG
jgi:hypothetical protein